MNTEPREVIPDEFSVEQRAEQEIGIAAYRDAIDALSRQDLDGLERSLVALNHFLTENDSFGDFKPERNLRGTLEKFLKRERSTKSEDFVLGDGGRLQLDWYDGQGFIRISPRKDQAYDRWDMVQKSFSDDELKNVAVTSALKSGLELYRTQGEFGPAKNAAMTFFELGLKLGSAQAQGNDEALIAAVREYLRNS